MDDTRKIIPIEKDLQNSFSSYNYLCEFAYRLQSTDFPELTIDMSRVNFVAANLFSVVGCLLANCSAARQKEGSLSILGMKPKIRETIQKNGFCHHFGLEKLPDTNNTVIPYRIFEVNEILEYERYLTINLFTREDLPPGATDDRIRDSLLELFKNVIDHTTSKNIYTCGQYFPRSSMLFFTIVDMGETIPYNVREFHNLHDLLTPDNCLEWAIQSGNTTSLIAKPRGLGLFLIKDFILENKGSFYIVSGYENYEINRGKEKFRILDYPFPGTVVTVGFNLSNNTSSYMFFEGDNAIQF